MTNFWVLAFRCAFVGHLVVQTHDAINAFYQPVTCARCHLIWHERREVPL